MIDPAQAQKPTGDDPRASAQDPTGWADSAVRPSVARSKSSGGPALIFVGALALGLATFVGLMSQHSSQSSLDRAPPSATHTEPAPAPPSDVAAFQAQGRLSAPASLVSFTPPPATPTSVIPSIAPSPISSGASASNAAYETRLKAPSVVVDLADATPPPPAGAARPGAAALAGPSALTGNEQFAERVGGEQPERALATVLHNQPNTVPQGTMIPGVLETALNSDLPGYARAVVSRDVRGFDGSTILIPRGSRVIGQYRSAVADGQSRAFVIWTRILRPDGGSIQIGSSGTDALGRAGLRGSVNRHFLERLGGSVLLSVIDAEISSLGNRPTTQVVIGSSQEASNLAISALLPTHISPTIKVSQGSPIRIFVARDLDFSPAQGSGN